MKRENFIKKILFIAAGGIGTAFFFDSCSPIKYLAHTMKGDKIIVKKAELKGVQFALVNAENLPFPIYLRSLDNENYIALLTRCTHKGCEVIPYYDRLSCPCHGSEYSYTGEVISPPAHNPLMKFNVTTDRENIYIQKG